MDKLVHIKVLILDGNSELRTHKGKKPFRRNKIRFVFSLNFNRCLKYFNYQRLIFKNATISELPSNTSNIVHRVVLLLKRKVRESVAGFATSFLQVVQSARNQ